MRLLDLFCGLSRKPGAIGSLSMNTKQYKLLDLFSGAGGSAVGYYRAGFTDITGIDNRPMPRYPFKFIQADALDYLKDHGREFDLIHASPPCQGYSRMRHLSWLNDKQYPLLIPALRTALQATGKIWVIENVSDAPLNGPLLCAAALGLPFIRHRRFESNKMLLFPPCPGHPVIFKGGRTMHLRGKNGGVMGIPDGVDPRAVMETQWMTTREARQAVPPAYTHYIGSQLLRGMDARHEGISSDFSHGGRDHE